MLLDSDLPALEVDFLELQKPNWRALNGIGKQTSWDFQKCMIVHTLPEILMAQTGVPNQLKTARRLTPEQAQKWELNAQTGTKAGV